MEEATVTENQVDRKSKEHKKLVEAYSGLDKDERRIVEIISVAYVETTQTAIQQVVKELAWETESGKSLAAIVAKPLREKLIRKRIIISDGRLIRPHPMVLDLCSPALKQNNLYHKIAVAVEKVIPPTSHQDVIRYGAQRYSAQNDYKAGLQFTQRALRHADYTGETKYLKKLLWLDGSDRFIINPSIAKALIETVGEPVKKESLEALHPEIQIISLMILALRKDNRFLFTKDLYNHFEALSANKKYVVPYQINVLFEQRMLRLQLSKAREALDQERFFGSIGSEGWWLTLNGEYDRAIEIFGKSLKKTAKTTGKSNIYLPGMVGIFFFISLLASRSSKNIALLEKQLKTASSTDSFYMDQCAPPMYMMGEVSQVFKGMSIDQAEALTDHEDQFKEFPLFLLFQSLGLYWLGEKNRIKSQNRLKRYCLQYFLNGYYWFAFESALLLDNLIEDKKIKEIVVQAQAHKFTPVFSIYTPIEPWVRTLEALKNISNQSGPKSYDVRMVWRLHHNKDWTNFRLEPREQKMSKKGVWSKGRAVSLKKLYTQQEDYKYLTEQDRQICNQIEHVVNRYYGYPDEEFSLTSESALMKAIGHPAIFWENDLLKPVEIISGKPELHVSQKNQKVCIHIAPSEADILRGQSQILIQQEHTHRIKITQFSDQHLKIASLLGEDGLSVPGDAKERVLESISAIAPLLTVHSDIGGHDSVAESVESNQRLQIHIQQLQDGFYIHWYVQPFAPNGPLFNPGQGGKTVFTEVDSKRLQTTRNLEKEHQSTDDLMNGFPIEHRNKVVIEGNPFEWFVPDLEIALELLLYLNSFNDRVDVHWPEGRKVTITGEVKKEDMSLSVRSKHDWFELSGALSVDQDNVFEMEKLLVLLNETPGRFIRLDNDSFIALTQELRDKLDKLKTYTENGKFHLLASQALEEITDGMEINSCEQWEAILNRFNEANQLTFDIPSTLQADLRDYQVQGFEWMSRLSHWGAGACLADDMGLGKTLQALTIILARAPQGPTLVLAPTSVCMNWLEEVQRFTPTLNPTLFSQLSDRSRVTHVSKFDLVICSYGLLQTHIDSLKSVHWGTLVVDEAQAIKNPHAKRTKAAMELSGDFKIALTGTPIENHLGELWSLFRFINPGLLGSIERFNNRFAHPIENKNDGTAKEHLKKLTQPFILRRHKNHVLKELPPRTNILVNVELSKEEVVFYEALRQKAVKRIEGSEAPEAKKRFLVLTEIMKLRRACCNSSMVLPDSNIKSSKLEALSCILDELLENKHKALIFSQFVDHLKIIRQLLDKKNIPYQYLDGQTTEKKRKQSVDAFQSGQGDIFLISLKAGGVGLNLTAADYVIHMDPWWNPAVEDQASDRAHRMGQKRPVTIYRMVTSNTIEEKIVYLHDHKRDLATNLLEGNDFSGKISVEEMMSLIS